MADFTYTCPVHGVDFTCEIVGEFPDYYMLWMYDEVGHFLIIGKDDPSLK